MFGDFFDFLKTSKISETLRIHPKLPARRNFRTFQEFSQTRDVSVVGDSSYVFTYVFVIVACVHLFLG